MSLFTGEETMAQRDTATKSQSWDSNSGQCLPEALAPPTASTAPCSPRPQNGEEDSGVGSYGSLIDIRVGGGSCLLS